MAIMQEKCKSAGSNFPDSFWQTTQITIKNFSSQIILL